MVHCRVVRKFITELIKDMVTRQSLCQPENVSFGLVFYGEADA